MCLVIIFCQSEQHNIFLSYVIAILDNVICSFVFCLAGCSSGYNVSMYRDYALLNTQVAEQRNATLNRLKSSLSYMHEENFFLHLSVFLSYRNIINILKLRAPANDDEVLIYQLVPLYSKWTLVVAVIITIFVDIVRD